MKKITFNRLKNISFRSLKNINYRGIKVKKSKIGAKLTSILILLSLLPTILLGIVSYISSQRIMESRFQVTTEQTISEISRGLDNKIGALKTQLSILSSNINLKEVHTNESFEPLIAGILRDYKQNNDGVSSVYFGSMTKKVFSYPKLNLPSDFDPSSRPWYIEASKNKEDSVLTKLYKDAKTGQSVVTIAKAVEYQGDVVGVVAMDLDMNRISEQISNIKIGKEGYVFTTNQEGIVLTHPDKNLLGTDVPTTLSYWTNVSKNEKGFEEYLYNGTKKFNVYVTNSETGWKILGAIERHELLDDINIIRNAIVIFAAAAGFISVLVAVRLSRWITGNIAVLNSSFEKAAEGDLTIAVNMNSKDEFGELGSNYNKMLSNISKLIKRVQDASDSIKNSSENISMISEQTNDAINETAVAIDSIASGAAGQTREIENSVQELEKLGDDIDNVVALVTKLGMISRSTDDTSREGLKIIETLFEKSAKSKDSSLRATDTVHQMNSTADKIGNIAKTINGIADQTNILALNAAIEAARAGEAGRGFAIVAEEVRKLAEQSTAATKEIEKLIQEAASKSIAAVSAMKESSDIVEEQSMAVEDTRNIFNSIIQSVQKLLNGLENIKSSVEETNDKKDKVIERMHNISAVSEESTASTEEVSASTEEITASMNEFINNANEMKDISERLQKSISKFTLH
jgi:methyl-accepting chemotaxis protein